MWGRGEFSRAGACRSFLITLDPVAVEAVGASSWPEGISPYVVQVRRLSCGARDVLLRTNDESGTLSIWSIRITGRAGLP